MPHGTHLPDTCFPQLTMRYLHQQYFSNVALTGPYTGCAIVDYDEPGPSKKLGKVENIFFVVSTGFVEKSEFHMRRYVCYMLYNRYMCTTRICHEYVICVVVKILQLFKDAYCCTHVHVHVPGNDTNKLCITSRRY